MAVLISWWHRTWWHSVARAKALRAYIMGWEYITGVAIVLEYGGVVEMPRPYRHNHCIELAYRKNNKYNTTRSQGFITNTGRYVDRAEGLKIAKAAKQLLPRHDHKTELFSESIW